jgi:hypothetical protein
MVQVLMRLLGVVGLLMLTCAVASAQTCNGNLPAGTVCGNPGPGAAAGRPITAANTLSVATPAALVAATIPAHVQIVTVTSMSGTVWAPNASACSLNFARGTGTPTGIYGELLNGMTYWEPIYSTSPVHACEFGTIADGVLTANYTTGAVVITGTDNTPMIQAAINFALQNLHEGLCLDDGRYKITDTIHLGYGETFHDLGLKSCSAGRASFDLGGPTLLPTFFDRCAVNVQGARTDSIQGLAIIGQNYAYAFSSAFPAIFPTTPSGWLLPAITPTGTNPGGLQRYAPYGGVCTDGYAGTPPSQLGAFANYPSVTNYPSFTKLSSTSVSINTATPAVVTWPANAFGNPGWLNSNCQFGLNAFYARCPIIFTAGSLPSGLSLNTYYYVGQFLSANTFTISATPGGTEIGGLTAASGLSASRQYGMSGSSNIMIQDSDIEGFAVNISSNASTNQAQDDFFKVDRVTLGFCVYCISIGNDQSRNVYINNVTFSETHTFLTNNKFGEQLGVLGGPISNVSGGQSYQIFDISGTSFGFPVTINDLYTEASVRIGSIDASNGNSVFFNGCDLNFGGAILPAAYLEAVGGTFYFKDCSFAGIYNRIDVLTHGAPSVIFDGGNFVIGTGALPFLNLPGIPVAQNYTGGVLISGSSSLFPQSNNKSVRFLGNVTTRAMTSQTTFQVSQLQVNVDFDLFPGRAPVTQASRGWFDGLTQAWHEFAALPQVYEPNLTLSTFTTVAPSFGATCDVLTFSYKSAFMAANSANSNINPGDILVWSGDGTIFVVTQVGALSGGAYPITARQMNNMIIGYPGSYACVTNNISDPTLNGPTRIIHAAGTSYNSVAPIGSGAPGGIMIPQQLSYGDFANGSTAVKNVAYNGPTGDGTTLSTYYKVGDIMWGLPFSDPANNWPFTSNSGGPLATVTNGGAGPLPGSLVLGTAANGTGRFPISPIPLKGEGIARSSLPAQAYAALPTCAAGILGLQATITDSTVTTVGMHATAGGSTGKVQVVCDSTPGWLIQSAL